MTYSEACSWLFDQFPSYQLVGTPAYKPSLVNTERLCAMYGNPELRLRFIHIAGTNGKGSTSSFLASTLKEAGYQTGLFTSPHLLDFRERIRVNGKMVAEEVVISFVEKLKLRDLDFEPSFFEITWVLALLVFEANHCEICVIETGLGGRLDSTNVITPELSVITNIGIDHTQFLGTTLAQIASEKAGIIKNGIPVVLGETLPETKSVFVKKANTTKSKIIWAEKNKFEKPKELLGAYQEKNFATFCSAVEELNIQGWEITETHIQLGIKNLTQNTGFRGRMELIQKQPNVYVDVAHNFDGIKSTLQTIEANKTGKLYLMYAASNDKELNDIFSIFPKDADYVFTEFEGIRSAKAASLQLKAKEFNLNSKLNPDPKMALAELLSSVNEEDTVLIFGSFFLVQYFV